MPHPAAPRAADTGSNRAGASTTGSNRAGHAPSGGTTTGADRVGADTGANQYGAYPPAAGPFGGHAAASTTGANQFGPPSPAAGSFGHTPGADRLDPTGANSRGGVNQFEVQTTGLNPFGANPAGAGRPGGTTSAGAANAGVTWSSPGPARTTDAEAGTSPYGMPTNGAATATPVDSSWRVDRQASQPFGPASDGTTAGQPAASTGAHYSAPFDLSGAPATTGGRSRSEVPQAWAHESGGHLGSRPDTPAGDAIAAPAQPIPSWELSLPPATPPVRAPIAETIAREQAPLDPEALPTRAAAPDRTTGHFDPLVDPLPVLDPLPAPDPTWTEAAKVEPSGRYDAASSRRDRSAAPVNGAAEPRWLAAELLQNRDRSPSRWRAADLLADRDAGHAHTARGGDSSTGQGPAHDGGARLPGREADDAGGNGPAASRWLAADLLNGGREGRAPTDRDDPDSSRWLAADLLNRRSGIDGRQAPQSATTPEGQHLRSEATGSRWQAADLLTSRNGAEPGLRAAEDRQAGHDDSSPRTWRAAELLRREREVSSPHLADSAAPWGEEPKSVGRAERRRRSEAAGAGAGRRSATTAETGRREGRASHVGDEPPRHGGGSRHNATTPRVPPTQWAWPKEPEPTLSESARARRAGDDAWSAADLLDEGRHAGGRRRARESARHDAPADPHDDDAGRHYRP